MIKRPATSKFYGLNNVQDPLRLGLEWLTQADNVDVTDQLQLRRARGYVRSTTNTAVSGAYATEDMQALYVVDSGELRSYNAALGYSVLRTGLSSRPMYFVEVSGDVYYTNGIDYGLIRKGGVDDAWGIEPPPPPLVQRISGDLRAGLYQVVATYSDDRGMESGNSQVVEMQVSDDSSLVITSVPMANIYVTDTDGTVFFLVDENSTGSFTYNSSTDFGRELPYWNVGPPRGTIPALFKGQIYLAEPFPMYNQTVIWFSLPVQYHHFDASGDALVVPGTVRMMAAVDEALIIGTDRQIWAWNGEKLDMLAEYGVVSGWHAEVCDKQAYFWSLRGLCTAMPFRNLTQSTISVAPGASAGAAVIEKDGRRRYTVALVKGTTPAYNARSTEY